MMKWKFGQKGDTKSVKVHSLSCRDRFIKPTEQQITEMTKSLEENGQLTPILVTHVTRNTYRVVAGATRMLAATRLHWDKIDATIIGGSERDLRIIELTENLDRKSLSVEQRKTLRAERRRLIAETVERTEPSKGGRGKKGGLRQAARELGVSQRTAQRASKVTQNAGSASVSEPALPAAPAATPVAEVLPPVATPPPAPVTAPYESKGAHVPPSMRGQENTKLSITWSLQEDARFEEYRKQEAAEGRHVDRSHTARRIVNDFLSEWERQNGRRPNLQLVGTG